MKFDPIFSSHMVLPANKTLRLYGEGEGKATLEFAGVKRETVCENGKWCVEFPPMNYGGPFTVRLSSESFEAVLDDVYVGEVYLLAGQSNIEFRLEESNTPKERYLSNNMLRYFAVDKITSNIGFCPDDGWCEAKAESVKYWSAIGYLAGFEIAEKKNIAVGLINCNQGASVIESWVPEGTFEALGVNIPIEKKRITHTYEAYRKWNIDGKLYNYQLSQVFPFALSGVVWYQGEADAYGEEAEVYDVELCALIDTWRRDFRDEKLKFYIIQIADYTGAADPVGWKKVQEIQAKMPSLRENAFAVISPVLEPDEIHPPTKDRLAHRLAEVIMEKKWKLNLSLARSGKDMTPAFLKS